MTFSTAESSLASLAESSLVSLGQSSLAESSLASLAESSFVSLGQSSLTSVVTQSPLAGGETIVLLPTLVAFLTAILTLLVRFDGRLERGVSLLGGIAYTLAGAELFRQIVLVGDGAVVPYYVSDWPAPFGITLVADGLSAAMVGLTAVIVVPTLGFALVYVDRAGQRLAFHPLFHFMIAGVTGAFLTGDVFNLFVWFEVMLMATYVLVIFYSGPDQTRAGTVYVVLNLVGSAVMLLAIGGLYATIGTLNMADMVVRLSEPAAYDVAVGPTLGLVALLLSVFALKAGLVPFHFWVPATYRAAPIPVTAVLAAVVKKVGVYAVVRLFFTVFAAADYASGSALAYVGPVLLVAAAASVLYGGLAAVGQEDMTGVLAFSSVGQIGFVFLPLGVAMTLGSIPGGDALPGGSLATLAVAAALVYSFNHAVAKGGLFLVGGTVRSVFGTTRLTELGGLARRTPLVATAFLLGGLSLIGIPPLLGFFGKLLVFRVGVVAGSAVGGPAALVGWGAVLVALVGAVLTIAYVTRTWNAVFWGEPSARVTAAVPNRWQGIGASRTDEPRATAPDGGFGTGDADPRTIGSRTLVVEVVAGLVLAIALIGFGLGAELVVDAAVTAGEAAVDSAGYADGVLPDNLGAGNGAGGENGASGTGEGGEGS